MPPKKKANPQGKYTIHSNHDSLPAEKTVMRYISFDPGEFNFDVRLEKRICASDDTTGYCKSIKTVAQARYLVDYGRKKIGLGTKSSFSLQIVDILSNYSEFLTVVDIVLIERQMKVNSDMIELQSSLIMFFILCYPQAVVLDVSSKLKSKNLNVPDGLTRHFLKKWSIDTAISYAEARGDTKFLEYIESQVNGHTASDIKIDDDTDNLLQIEAFCVQAGYRLTKL